MLLQRFTETSACDAVLAIDGGGGGSPSTSLPEALDHLGMFTSE